MQATTVIAKTRDAQELTSSEIAFLVRGYVQGEVPDYQMAAWLMAVYLNGMSDSETAILTHEMLRSGTTLTWPDSQRPIADKHSTGGVGDKVSLVLAPLLACAGLSVPMVSGRGLGPTGGTLDKLESIEGFRTDLTCDEIRQITAEVGCVITGATQDIAPADRQLYALRDVTETVASIPLITASIMSKKLAAGLDALVLDVKFGSGAFMKTASQARQLAQSLVATGTRMGVATVALLSDMNQPLGRMVGNALEIDEAVATLSGRGPSDLVELTCALGAQLLCMTDRAANAEAARQTLQQALDSGSAYDKLGQMVAAQGGNLSVVRPRAAVAEMNSSRQGFVKAIDTEALGQAVIELGGGRRVLTDNIDHGVGIEMLVRIGDEVDLHQPLLRLFSRPSGAERVLERLREAISIVDERTEPVKLIAGRVAG